MSEQQQPTLSVPQSDAARPPQMPTTTMLPPQRDPFPGSLTPGWNDPPPLTSSTASANSSGSRTRLDLRKRVPFPLHGQQQALPQSSTSCVSPAGGLLPTTTVDKPIAKVPPQCATMTYTQPSRDSGSTLPPLPPLPPKADASGWPVAAVPPRQK